MYTKTEIEKLAEDFENCRNPEGQEGRDEKFLLF